MRSHGRGLYHVGDAQKHALPAGGVYESRAVDVEHLTYRLDAPAVKEPVVEIRITVGRCAPDQCPVAYDLRALSRGYLLSEYGIHPVVIAQRRRISAGDLMLKDTVQPHGSAGMRRDLRAVHVPLFEFSQILTVPYLTGLF